MRLLRETNEDKALLSVLLRFTAADQFVGLCVMMEYLDCCLFLLYFLHYFIFVKTPCLTFLSFKLLSTL